MELALLEKPAVAQLLKNFTIFYGTRRLINASIRALHWSQSSARSIQSIPPRPISPRSILILSTHLRIGRPSGLFPSGYPTNILYAFLFSLFVQLALPISSSLTWSFTLHLGKSTIYGAPRYTVSSNFLSLRPSSLCYTISFTWTVFLKNTRRKKTRYSE
jgi:hypothetical protein